MSLKVSDLKVGDVIIMTETNDSGTREFLNRPLVIAEIIHDVAYCTEKMTRGYSGRFWVNDSDTFTYAIPYINEQKLRKKLGLLEPKETNE